MFRPLIAIVAAAFLAIPAVASADPREHRAPPRHEVRHEIRHERREIRHERREIRHERREGRHHEMRRLPNRR